MRKIEVLVPVGEVKLGQMIKVAPRPSNLEGKVVVYCGTISLMETFFSKIWRN